MLVNSVVFGLLLTIYGQHESLETRMVLSGLTTVQSHAANKSNQVCKSLQFQKAIFKINFIFFFFLQIDLQLKYFGRILHEDENIVQRTFWNAAEVKLNEIVTRASEHQVIGWWPAQGTILPRCLCRLQPSTHKSIPALNMHKVPLNATGEVELT